MSDQVGDDNDEKIQDIIDRLKVGAEVSDEEWSWFVDKTHEKYDDRGNHLDDQEKG